MAYAPPVNRPRSLIALALSTCALLAVSACADQTTSSNPTAANANSSASSDEAQIRTVVAGWTTAINDQDYSTACALQTRRFTNALLEEMDGEFTCPEFLEASTGGGSDLDHAVAKVNVTRQTATAMVGTSEWRFAEIDGEWLINYLN